MQLSQRQQQTIATALTIIASVVIVASVLGLFWILAVFARTFSNVLLPLVAAGVLSLVFQPYYDLLRVKLRLPTPLAIAALFLSILMIFRQTDRQRDSLSILIHSMAQLL
ncbi:hypothetical protein IIB79_01030 [candidate division KSB1 bacterium]|nr:hypothetical protein [candidate division KSB1 bacterium]